MLIVILSIVVVIDLEIISVMITVLLFKKCPFVVVVDIIMTIITMTTTKKGQFV